MMATDPIRRAQVQHQGMQPPLSNLKSDRKILEPCKWEARVCAHLLPQLLLQKRGQVLRLRCQLVTEGRAVGASFMEALRRLERLVQAVQAGALKRAEQAQLGRQLHTFSRRSEQQVPVKPPLICS